MKTKTNERLDALETEIERLDDDDNWTAIMGGLIGLMLTIVLIGLCVLPQMNRIDQLEKSVFTDSEHAVIQTDSGQFTNDKIEWLTGYVMKLKQKIPDGHWECDKWENNTWATMEIQIERPNCAWDGSTYVNMDFSFDNHHKTLKDCQKYLLPDITMPGVVETDFYCDASECHRIYTGEEKKCLHESWGRDIK